jgi:hypothetical protein
MAIARCENHPIQREPKQPYVAYALPIGFPATAAVCGRVGCDNPALIWLTAEEVHQYKGGQRVFSVKTHSVRVRVHDLISNRDPARVSCSPAERPEEATASQE